MKLRRSGLGWFAVALGCAAFLACTASSSSEEAAGESSAELARAALPDELTFELSWSEVTLRPAGNEIVADGPSAVAALPNGEVLVLDRLAGRVIALAHGQAPRTVAAVAKDAQDLVAGPDGAFVAFSPMRATAWFFDASGKGFGQLEVPREIRELTSLTLGKSRRLSVQTGYQELLDIGSPSAPIALPVVLAGKREGALVLDDGRGIAVQASNDQVKLLVVSQPTPDQRSQVVRSFTLPHAATAARIVGRSGSTVCVRSERVTSTPAIQVDRRAICLDAVTGDVIHDRALPAVGVYLPRTELAVGGGRLLFLHPTDAGLSITSTRLSKKGVQ
jgi:hypothetical protein